MIPIQPTSGHIAHWVERDGCEQHPVVVGGPEEGADVIPCPALIAADINCVHVAYQLDEIEVAMLAQGGTLWLTTWGMVPVHLIDVQAPEARS